MGEAKPQLAIVAGAGPGLGRALLARFQAGGFRAIGLARSAQSATDTIEMHNVDLTKADDLRQALEPLIAEYGPPKVVVHNPAALVISPFAECSPSEFEALWRTMVLSAVHLAQLCIPAMVDGGGGTFAVSGATASLRGGARFAAFASAKFALRGLTQSLAREYQKQGLHVAHVILDGIIDTPRSRELHALDPSRMMKPADIAECYWQLAHQPRSTWTHELDLRPHAESF